MRDPALPRRSHRRALRRLAARALGVALLLALVLAPSWLPAPARRGPGDDAHGHRPRRRRRGRRPSPGAAPRRTTRPARRRPTPCPARPALRRPDAAVAGRAGAERLRLHLHPQLGRDQGRQLHPLRGHRRAGGRPVLAPAPAAGALHRPPPRAGAAAQPGQRLRRSRGLHLHPPPGPGGGRRATTAVPAWLRRVQGTGGGSPVAVAAGDLDGRVSAQGFPNDEVAVASRDPDGTLRVDVIDYNVAPGDAVETAPTVALPAIGTPAAGPGSLGVGVGDFDSDGQNEIAVLWQGGGCTAPPAPAVPLRAPPLDAALHQHRPDPLPRRAAGGRPPPGGAGGRLARPGHGLPDGRGRLRRPGAATCWPSPTSPRTRPWPCWASPGATRRSPSTASAPSPATSPARPTARTPGAAAGPPGCRPSSTPGLFWYDEASGHGLGRRQLALTALQQLDGGVRRRAGAAGLRRRLRRRDLRPGSAPAAPCRSR